MNSIDLRLVGPNLRRALIAEPPIKRVWVMTVSVKFFANVKKLMGKSEIRLHIDPSKHISIKDILQEIARYENKELLPLLSDAEGVPLGAVRVVLNGKIVHSPGSFETTVQDGDKIAIFPLLAGG